MNVVEDFKEPDAGVRRGRTGGTNGLPDCGTEATVKVDRSTEHGVGSQRGEGTGRTNELHAWDAGVTRRGITGAKCEPSA